MVELRMNKIKDEVFKKLSFVLIPFLRCHFGPG